VYDLLLRYNCHIVGEKSVPINHCLIANPGVAKGDLKRVLSHPQALAQCDQYLRDMHVVREGVDDTAGAHASVAMSR
jgi:arogenate/prephenate dehydratase